MPEILHSVLGPALALVGTLVAAFLGYRQWKKQQDLARYGGFLSERQAAYKDLWQKLEAVHLCIRSQEFREEEFHELVRAANTLRIKAGLYLDEGEDKRVNDYLAALGSLGKVLATSPSTNAKDAAQHALCDTTEIPREVLLQVKGLADAYAGVDQQRELLIRHFRQVLGARFFA
jgi:hypothetical protein